MPEHSWYSWEEQCGESDYTTGVEKSIADLTFVRTIRDWLFKDQYEKKSPFFGSAKKTTSKSFPGYRGYDIDISCLLCLAQ